MDWDLAYANGAFIPGAEAFPGRWAAQAASFRQDLGPRARLDIPYGPAGRHRLDLFLPQDQPRGLMMFIHGGYWLAFGRETWSHLAAGAVARGWACAVPSYPLAPEARLHEMTQAMVAALAAAAAQVAGPIVVTGHSAGGHLSARMGCIDGPPGVVRVVPISPLAELEPLTRTKMQAQLAISAEEVAVESPARRRLRPGVGAHVWVGGQERPSFLWQARLLSEAWDCPWTVDPGRHHFDVVDGLTDPSSALMSVCLDGL